MLLPLLEYFLGNVSQAGQSTVTSSGVWGSRLRSLLPQSWFSATALTKQGAIGGLMEGLGYMPASLSSQLAYAKNQTRLLTASDTNLDNAGVDFFALGWTRYMNESDSVYAQRIIARLLWPQPTLAGITDAVNAWLYGLSYRQRQSPMGMDTYGAMDTTGSLDVTTPFPGNVNNVIAFDTVGGLDTAGGMDIAAVVSGAPTVYVFDLQSDPTMSAQITPNIAPPQFCVYFRYPGYADSLIHPINSYDTVLTYLVNYVKAEGTVPVFASNYF